MPRTRLEDQYFTRMAAAVNDKARILEHLVPGTVADVGAGGGELASLIATHPKIAQVYAIDDARDSVRRLQGRPKVTAVHGSFDTLAALSPDNIVLCSVLHEVWSYGGHDYATRWAAWTAAIEACVAALPTGGRLIIRDGVMPNDPAVACSLVAPDDDADRLMERYATMVPKGWPVPLRSGPRSWTGTAATLSEAMLTVNWGEKSLARESQERVALLPEEGYAAVVRAQRPLMLLGSLAYTQAGYREHLSGWALTDQDGLDWFPFTNALWVFEKTANSPAV